MSKSKQDVLPKDKTFKRLKNNCLTVTYGDVRLKTGQSNVLPNEVDITSRFSRNVPLKSLVVGAAMNTVTEEKMAVTLAKLGGLGIIHRNMPIERQIKMVGRVKHNLHGFIDEPIFVRASETMEQVLALREQKRYSFHSFPVLDENGRVTGILTRNDFDFCDDLSQKVENVMTKDPIHVDQFATIEQVYDRMREAKVKALPSLNDKGSLLGLYTFSDVRRIITGSADIYNLDDDGRLRVGIAVGTDLGDIDAVNEMHDKGLDVVVIDTAHGDSQPVFDKIRALKENIPDLDVVAGNISEGAAAKRLMQAGVDGIKVGQGPGSICTTRIVAGIGCPQITAIYNCAREVRGYNIPVCADGGLKYSGDIPIAIGAGADNVMMGSMLAGTKEAPGDIISHEGRRWKKYDGMGSLSAMQENRQSRQRYLQEEDNLEDISPEGVEAMVPYKGPVTPIFKQYIQGLRKGMGYVGAESVEALQRKADFNLITQTGSAESHPHSVRMVKDAPNYRGQ